MSKPATNSASGVYLCPRCHREKLVYLKSMRNHDSRDWYKCDGCEHIVTKPREVAAEGSTITPEAGSLT
jgi:hypothetical protein